MAATSGVSAGDQNELEEVSDLCQNATTETVFVNYTDTGVITETTIVFTPTDSTNPKDWKPWVPRVKNGGASLYALSKRNSPTDFAFSALTFWIDSSNPKMPARTFRPESPGTAGPLFGVTLQEITIGAEEVTFCVANQTKRKEDFPVGLEATIEDTSRLELGFLLTSRDPQIIIEGED